MMYFFLTFVKMFTLAGAVGKIELRQNHLGPDSRVSAVRSESIMPEISNTVHPVLAQGITGTDSTSNDGTSHDGTSNDGTSNDSTSHDGTSNPSLSEANSLEKNVKLPTQSISTSISAHRPLPQAVVVDATGATAPQTVRAQPIRKNMAQTNLDLDEPGEPPRRVHSVETKSESFSSAPDPTIRRGGAEISITLPDMNQPLDVAVVAFFAIMTVVAGTANRWQIPFLTREGGLLTYAKFAEGVTFGFAVPSRVGMTLLYTPACAIGLYNLQRLTKGNILEDRAALASLLMVMHFGKRMLECLFLHKYSGTMPLATSPFIAFYYSVVSFCCTHYSGMSPPFAASGAQGWAFCFFGLQCFVVGQGGNLYHHYLLATLREPGETEYKVPRGGFFDLWGGVACPHYFFELIAWLGVALVSQHVVPVMILICMTVYLFDRAVAQSEWNWEKFGDEGVEYPKSRKHIIPMVF